jgi:hypothetical protein
VFLCGHVADAGDGNVHLAWVFDAIRPDAYPHTQKVICVTVQLTDGIGDVPVSVKVVQLAEDLEPKTIVNSQPVWFSFPKRLTVHRAILRLTNGVFPKAGLYLIEVDCGDDCVGDAPLRLFPAEEEV